MKKKKGKGLFGTTKRKAAQRAEKHKKEYYDESEEYNEDEYYDEPEEYIDEDEYYESEEYENDEEYYEPDGYEGDGEYYESEEYVADDEYYESEEYEDDGEYYESEEYAADDEYYESEEYEDDGEYYESEEYVADEEYYEPDEYEDDGEYYESEEYAADEEYLYAEYDNEEGFDTGYEGNYQTYGYDESEEDYFEEASSENILERIKAVFKNMTAFDAIVAVTGVVVLVAAIVIFSIYHTSNLIEDQIEAIVPVGNELSSVGIVGESGLLAMADAKIAGQGDTEVEAQEVITSEAEETKTDVRVSVSFTSVERDLKIRFTDATTGELITGTAFEVVLTNSSGKKLILTDDDMDGIIYATSVNAGKFDAVITSTDKYKFPTTPQQVTVKDKVEYVVINVQDEVKTEAQVNVAVEDTEEKVAVAEEVKLTDTVEWVESSKTAVSGTEGYTKIEKSTIPDPSQLSLQSQRMFFDTLNVTLDKTSLKLYTGSTDTLKGTSFSDYEETLENGDKNAYKFSTEWKSSNESVATVSGGTVTAKDAGTATITYTVTRKTTTTKTIAGEKKEETKTEEVTISAKEYEKLSEEEKAKCTEKDKDDNGQVTSYTYKKTTTITTEGESKTETSENTETFSATCEVTVEKVQISSGSLELTKTADACNVRGTLTVKPSKLVYTKNDGSTETITSNFPTVYWSSSDTSVASVDSSTGVVTGVKQGTATITGQIKGIKDASGKELDIKATTTVTVNAAAALTIKLDREQVWLGVKGQTTLVPTVSNYVSDSGVTWTTADKNIATVDEKGVVTGVAAGTVKITATTKEKDANGKQLTAICVVTINSNATEDTSTRLKDKDGRQVYIKNSEGKYIEAVYADYFKASEFFIMNSVQYAYKGWQTIDGRTYYYDKNGNVVTGTQIIQGVTYNFGSDGAIQTTVNGSTFGIDVSKHNGKIDWNAVKSSGVDYVIIRCAYRGSSTGALITDPNFHTNIKGATAAGLKVGIYVFSQAVNEVEAVKEASLAVSLAQGYNLTYPIFIDTEASGGRADKIDVATRTAVVNAFCQTVQNAGYKAGIYASKAWYEGKLNMGSLGGYKIWLAQYAAKPTYAGRYDMWQYSSKGTISGINGKVDLNLSYLGY